MTATVLVVADDDSRRGSMVSALAPGPRTEPAEGGLDGLKRLDDGPADCVVVDAALSDVAVGRFVALLREDHPSVPVVVVGEPGEAVARAFREGATDYLRSAGRELVERVEAAVAEHRARAAVDAHGRLRRALGGATADAIDASSREGIERAVYDRLMATDLYRFAWVGEYDPGAGTLSVRVPMRGTFAGPELESLGGVDALLERAASGDVAAAGGSVSTRGASASASGVGAAPGGDGAAAAFDSAAVPLAHDGSVHGVVLASTARPGAFDSAERSLLGEIGAVAGYALDRRREDDQFEAVVSNVVHELRSPLGVALAQLEVAREDGDPGAFDEVEAALRRIERLVENVSALARLAVEETTTRDLAETASAAWEEIDAPGADLVVVGPGRVDADHDLVERLFSNLFRNAVAHAGGDVTVRVGALPDGFYVEDDGPGVPEDERERVFDRGYTTGDDGLGLGLDIVRSVADAHGWEVSLSAGDGGGARFEVSGVDVEAPTGGSNQ